MNIQIPSAKSMTQAAEQVKEIRKKKEEEEKEWHRNALDVYADTVIEILVHSIRQETKQGNFSTTYKFIQTIQIPENKNLVAISSDGLIYLVKKISELFIEKGYRVVDRALTQRNITIEWY